MHKYKSLDRLLTLTSKLQPTGKSGQIDMTGMTQRKIRVLIVSHPGMMRNVLKDTFSWRTDVDIVGLASGGLSAVGTIREKQPDLVVIDSNLPATETRALISWMKEECSDICSLVLVETTKQLTRAESAGADIALLSYTLPDKLDKVLADLPQN